MDKHKLTDIYINIDKCELMLRRKTTFGINEREMNSCRSVRELGTLRKG